MRATTVSEVIIGNTRARRNWAHIVHMNIHEYCSLRPDAPSCDRAVCDWVFFIRPIFAVLGHTHDFAATGAVC